MTPDGQGRLTLGALPAGRYTYRASAENHIEATGRVLIQPGITVEERTFLDFSLVSIEWSVVETTINDIYDVVLSATYQTEVPAPVVLMEPLNIHLPELQIGEVKTGVITVTNYGFIRADNVRLTPPPENPYYKIEIMGDLPDSLDAKQRVLLNYKITGLGIPTNTVQEGQIRLARAAASGSFCGTGTSLLYTYICAAGDERLGGAGSSFNTSNTLGCTLNPRPGGGEIWHIISGGSSSPAQPCVPDGSCVYGVGGSSADD